MALWLGHQRKTWTLVSAEALTDCVSLGKPARVSRSQLQSVPPGWPLSSVPALTAHLSAVTPGVPGRLESWQTARAVCMSETVWDENMGLCNYSPKLYRTRDTG